MATAEFTSILTKLSPSLSLGNLAKARLARLRESLHTVSTATVLGDENKGLSFISTAFGLGTLLLGVVIKSLPLLWLVEDLLRLILLDLVKRSLLRSSDHFLLLNSDGFYFLDRLVL